MNAEQLANLLIEAEDPKDFAMRQRALWVLRADGPDLGDGKRPAQWWTGGFANKWSRDPAEAFHFETKEQAEDIVRYWSWALRRRTKAELRIIQGE